MLLHDEGGAAAVHDLNFGRDRPVTSTILPARLVNTKHGGRGDTRRIKVSTFHLKKRIDSGAEHRFLENAH